MPPLRDIPLRPMPPLHNALSRANHAQQVIDLIFSGADLEAIDNIGERSTGMTALHFAAMGGDASSVIYLIAAGANSRAKDNENKTALECASLYKDVASILSVHAVMRGDVAESVMPTFERKRLFAACQSLFTMPRGFREVSAQFVACYMMTALGCDSPILEAIILNSDLAMLTPTYLRQAWRETRDLDAAQKKAYIDNCIDTKLRSILKPKDDEVSQSWGCSIL
jgi:hypothetical protein